MKNNTCINSLNEFELNSKVLKRENKYMIYMKESLIKSKKSIKTFLKV